MRLEEQSYDKATTRLRQSYESATRKLDIVPTSYTVYVDGFLTRLNSSSRIQTQIRYLWLILVWPETVVNPMWRTRKMDLSGDADELKSAPRPNTLHTAQTYKQGHPR